ncbi:hypothetical protein Acy02nite_62530 [Actinoplanes cyaneus]|uniref:Uncharacterized protein n=1 Tax=Actinoplanes cyaneus TaxID=52696 RepID=A0A919IQ36_9ACTN|nr:hypothetical protein [Actinoplanes cyaneus]MCW2141548.1 hypothetical protein [Actinoplanes cyaneus]GID68372.1 hypothetical protein Acy02nite_62530 [Actinoplanes cyaneus]
MEPDLQGIAAAGAATIVGAMAGDAWKMAKQAVAHVCGRGRADAVEDVAAELELDRRRVTADADAEDAVRAYWADRLARLLAVRPDAAAELDALVRRLAAELPGSGSPAAAGHTFNVRARDRATVTVAGGNMRIGR